MKQIPWESDDTCSRAVLPNQDELCPSEADGNHEVFCLIQPASSSASSAVKVLVHRHVFTPYAFRFFFHDVTHGSIRISTLGYRYSSSTLQHSSLWFLLLANAQLHTVFRNTSCCARWQCCNAVKGMHSKAWNHLKLCLFQELKQQGVSCFV